MLGSSLTGCGSQLNITESIEADASAATDASVDTTTIGAITSVSDLDLENMFTSRDLDTGYDESNSATVTLNGDSVEYSGDGISVDGTTVTINAEGTYIFSGTLNDGQIVVNVTDTEKVQIVLDGVTITNDDGACIYVKAADKVFVTLAKDSENTLSDTGSEYVQEDTETNVDGVIFSKDDITFNGAGTLNINAGYANGIVGKDDVKFTGGTYNITATAHAIEGKDSVRIKDGSFNLVSGSEKDGIHSSNEEEEGKGYIYIEGGDINISAQEDGIHAATVLYIKGGTINIENSYEGLEGDSIDILGGDITVNSDDDGLNASTGTAQDAFGFGDMESGMEPGSKPEMTAEMEAGTQPEMTAGTEGETETTDIAGEAEGTETTAKAEETEGTETTAKAGNESGTEERMQGGHQGGMGAMDYEEDAYIHIYGGNLYINAEGDGIDSNGNLYIDGGNIIVDGPENSGNGALDKGGEAYISGGTIIAVGMSGMAETFSSDSEQYSVLYNFEETLEAGTEITITDSEGNNLMEYTLTKSGNSVVFSSEDLAEGDYTITAKDTSDTFTISDKATSAGAEGGMGMGQGGMGQGGPMGGQNDGNSPFADGEMPQMPNGEMPQMNEDGTQTSEDSQEAASSESSETESSESESSESASKSSTETSSESESEASSETESDSEDESDT